MVVLAVAHLALVVLVPWGDEHMPGFVLVPIGILDFALSLFCAHSVLKRYAG